MVGDGISGYDLDDDTVIESAGRARHRSRAGSATPDDAIVFDEAAIGDEPLSQAASYAGATLSLSRSGGADASDRFGATGTLLPLREGGALAVGSVRVGTVTRNSGGRLLLTFSGANASEDYVDSVLRQITYANASREPGARIDLHWSFADGAAGVLIADGHTAVTVDGAPIWRSAWRAA